MPPGWSALYNKPPASTPSLAGETTFLFIGKKKAMVFFSMFTHTKAALYPHRMRNIQPNNLLFSLFFQCRSTDRHGGSDSPGEARSSNWNSKAKGNHLGELHVGRGGSIISHKCLAILLSLDANHPLPSWLMHASVECLLASEGFDIFLFGII